MTKTVKVSAFGGAEGLARGDEQERNREATICVQKGSSKLTKMES